MDQEPKIELLVELADQTAVLKIKGFPRNIAIEAASLSRAAVGANKCSLPLFTIAAASSENFVVLPADTSCLISSIV